MAQTSTLYRLTTTPTEIVLTEPTQIVVSNVGESDLLIGLGEPFTNAVGHPLPVRSDSFTTSGTGITKITVSTTQTGGSQINTRYSAAVVTIID